MFNLVIFAILILSYSAPKGDTVLHAKIRLLAPRIEVTASLIEAPSITTTSSALPLPLAAAPLPLAAAPPLSVPYLCQSPTTTSSSATSLSHYVGFSLITVWWNSIESLYHYHRGATATEELALLPMVDPLPLPLLRGSSL